MKLLLDEMWPPALAFELRRQGHDIVAAAEQASLRGFADRVFFAWAQQEERVIVTENVRDFRLIAAEMIAHGHAHHGLILTSNRRFPRGDAQTAGRLVQALIDVLARDMAIINQEIWLT